MISRVHPLLFNVTVISMLVQIICRIITFSLNTLFIKVSNPTLTGVATLRLDALFNAILALSRTAHRNACIKFLHQDNGETNKHLNLLLDKLGSLILSHSFFDVLVLIAWQCVLGLRIDSVPPLVIIFALFSFTLSAFIVIVAAEPLYIISVCTEQTLARLMSESIFTVSKPLLLFLILRLQKHHAPSSETLLINLSATQMISALLYVFFMRLLVQFPAPTRKNKISSATCSQNSNKSTVGMPDKVEKCKLNRTLIDAPDSLTKFEVDHLDVENLDGLLKTIDDEAKLLSKQIRLDYVLKNHNTYCVNFLLPPNDQGLYAVASNYGSVVTRLLYQPIENAASLFYASKALDLQKGNLRVTKEYFCHMLHLNTILFLLGICFGPYLIKPLVLSFLGAGWSRLGLESILQAYCPLLGILAIHGGLDTFLTSTLSNDWLRYTKSTSFITTSFSIVSSFIIYPRYGSLGSIVVNIMTTILHASFCMYYAWKKLNLSFKHIFRLKHSTLFAFAVASLVNSASFRTYELTSIWSPHTSIVLCNLVTLMVYLLKYEL